MLALLLTVASCMSTAQRTGSAPYAARRLDHTVIVAETKDSLPVDHGPWVKIGEATATDNGWGGDVTKMLMQKARDLGGDALVGLQKYKTTQTFGIGWKDLAHAEVWRATHGD